MSVSTRLRNVGRLALAAGLTVAITNSVAVAQAPPRPILMPEWYLADVYQPQHTAARPVAHVQTAPVLAVPDYVTPVVGEEAVDCGACDCGTSCDCATSCDCGDACGTCCGPTWTCIAGTEITFLIPEIDDGYVSADLDDAGTIDDANNSVLDGDMEFAPRVWLGLQRGCWGVVTRFWYLDTCDSAGDPFEPDGFGYNLNTELEMYTLDLEVTRDLCLWGSQVVGSFGVRYASFDREGRLNSVGETDDGGVYSTNSVFRQYASGTGLTGSLSGGCPICGTCVSWFYSARGSLLWGQNDTLAVTQVQLGAGAGTATAENGAAATTDDPFIIAELKLGVMAEHSLQCYPADAFVRVAFEFQHWSGDDSQVTSNSFAGIGGTSVANADAFTAGLDTNLYGFSIGTGLTY